MCIDNGRSPKLARRQGDMFISTWDRGLLDGVRIENNTFYWSPLIDAPAVMMDHADFTGDKPNIVADNKMFTNLEALLVVPDASEDLAQDWNLDRVRVVCGTGKPGLQILDATEKLVAEWRGFVSPGELGLALRRQLGVPRPFATQ